MVDVPLNLGQRILEATRLAVAIHLQHAVATIGDRGGVPSSEQATSQQRARRVVIGRAGPKLAGDLGSGEFQVVAIDPTTDGKPRVLNGDRSRRSPFPAEGEAG